MLDTSLKTIQIGIDTGFGEIKGAYLHHDQETFWLERFASTFIPFGTEFKPAERSGEALRVICVDGQNFGVGRGASQIQSAQRIVDASCISSGPYIAMTLAMAAQVAEAIGCTTISKLAVGLPLDAFKNVQTKDSLKNSLCGNHCMMNAKTGKDYQLEIHEVKVYPQGQGAFFYYGTTVPNKAPFPAQMTIIDVGSCATNWIKAIGTKVLLAESDSFPLAGQYLKAQMMRCLNKQRHEGLTQQNMDRLIQTGVTYNGAVELNLDDLQAVLDEVFVSFARTLSTNFHLKRGEQILLSGGPALILKRAFELIYLRISAIKDVINSVIKDGVSG